MQSYQRWKWLTIQRLWEGRKWRWIDLEAGKVWKTIKHSASMIELCRQMGLFRQLSCVAKGLFGGGGVTLSAITFLPAPDRTLILRLQYHTVYIFYITQAQSSVFHSHIKVGMTDICSQGTQPFTYNHTTKRPSVIHFSYFFKIYWPSEILKLLFHSACLIHPQYHITCLKTELCSHLYNSIQNKSQKWVQRTPCGLTPSLIQEILPTAFIWCFFPPSSRITTL